MDGLQAACHDELGSLQRKQTPRGQQDVDGDFIKPHRSSPSPGLVSQESLEIPCSLNKYAYASLLPAIHACQLAEGETEQGKGSAGSSLGTQMRPAF